MRYVIKLIRVKVDSVDTNPNNPIAIMPLRMSSGKGSRDVFEYAEAIAASIFQALSLPVCVKKVVQGQS